MNKLVYVLGVIAVLAVGLGVWLIQAPAKDTFEEVLLFDDLQKFANQLQSVEIRNAQGVLFSAQKSDASWLASIDSTQLVYPISQSKLADFVETMMYAKLIEAKTSKPKNYIRLGLQPLDTDDSMATLVTFKALNKSWQVLVGNKVTVGEGHYILKLGDSQSWRTDKTISLPIDKFSWLKQPILPFQQQDILSVSRVDNLDWQIVKSASSDFQLINIPKDRELEYDSILNSVVSNLIDLNFEMLLTADEDFSQSLKILTQLEVSTSDGKIFQVFVSEFNDKYYVNFSSNDQPEYWQKWYYQVSKFSAQQLVKTLDDFLAEQSTTTSNSETSPDTVDEGDSPY
jgi:hypothetical protein